MDELQKTSEEIRRFLKFLEQTEKDYAWAIEEMNQAENLTQDYLHQLELQPSTYHGRAHLAKRLNECRVHRRRMKDMFAVYADWQIIALSVLLNPRLWSLRISR